MKIKKWRAKKRALLTEAHAQVRREWGKCYKDWTEEDWSGVKFSDECSVKKSKDPRTFWVLVLIRKNTTRT